jgi:hypothetical protein
MGGQYQMTVDKLRRAFNATPKLSDWAKPERFAPIR